MSTYNKNNNIHSLMNHNNSNMDDDDDDDDDDDGPPPMETLPDPIDNNKVLINTNKDVSSSNKRNEEVPLQQSLLSTTLSDKISSTTTTSQTNGDHHHLQQQQQPQKQQLESIEPEADDKYEQLCEYDEHILMKGRTTHPGLLEYDIAVQEFQNGVAAARKGQYNKAQELICCAFLRNELSIQHVPTLPSALLYEEYDNASIHVMEHTLFIKLLNHPHPQLIIFLLMQICAGCILGGGTIGDNDGKKRIQIAIKSGEKILEMYGKYWIDDINDIERYKQASKNNNKNNNNHNNKKNNIIHPDIMIIINELLNGTLKLWRIHRYQSALHSVVSNFLMTYTELDAALQSSLLDKNIPYMSSQIKFEIATLCLGCQLKPIHEVFVLLYQVICESVAYNDYYDTMCLPLCYAYLAMIACKNPSKINHPFSVTVNDAFMFMEESDRCQIRYEQLHCTRPSQQQLNNSHNGDNNDNNNQTPSTSILKLDTNSIDRLKIKMEFLKLIGDPKHITVWKEFDKQKRNNGAGGRNNKNNPWATIRQTRCLVSHQKQSSSSSSATKTITEGGDQQELPTQIFKCTRCKNAFYCSKECQRADWIIHKNYCKQYCS